MSCLKKVIATVETECVKSFTNVVLWSDGMGAQFRSKFIFQLIAGTMFLNKSLCQFYMNKSLCQFYNERHRGKVPIDDVDGTIKNVILRKVKSGQIVVQRHKEFSDAAMKFVLPIFTLYLVDQMIWLNLNALIRHHPSPKHIQSTNLFDRSITEEITV